MNRVLLAFRTWDEKKNELQPIAKGGHLDDTLLNQLQLKHLREAAHRLRETVRPDEIPFMKLLDHHIRRLDEKVYPNILQRLYRRVKDSLIDGPAYRKKTATAKRN